MEKNETPRSLIYYSLIPLVAVIIMASGLLPEFNANIKSNYSDANSNSDKKTDPLNKTNRHSTSISKINTDDPGDLLKSMNHNLKKISSELHIEKPKPHSRKKLVATKKSSRKVTKAPNSNNIVAATAATLAILNKSPTSSTTTKINKQKIPTKARAKTKLKANAKPRIKTKPKKTKLATNKPKSRPAKVAKASNQTKQQPMFLGFSINSCNHVICNEFKK